MRVAWLVLFGLLGACALPAYAARGVVREPDVDGRSLRTAGCLDIALGVRPPVEPTDNALLVVRFGNRCMRPVPFDLGSAVLLGYDDAGIPHELRLVDPRGEITLLHVDAGMSGVEKIRVAGAEAPLRDLCVDIARVVAGAPPPQRVCFRAKGTFGWEIPS